MLHRVDPDGFVLAALDPADTPGAPGDKHATKKATAALVEELAGLQERLWAEKQRSVLIVFQAIDAGGKDGAVKKLLTGVNPQGVRVHGFKAPTPIELDHDSLWRVHQVTPARGEIGVFVRSHYEDVLVVRVHDLVPEATWRKRYGHIRDFERLLVDEGTTILKFFLHISKEEQAERLQARLDDPAKRWKFRLGDLDERARWDDYQRAFEDAIRETATAEAPWFVVPADKKWFRNWAVAATVVAALRELDPQFPPAEEDLDGVVVE